MKVIAFDCEDILDRLLSNQGSCCFPWCNTYDSNNKSIYNQTLTKHKAVLRHSVYAYIIEKKCKSCQQKSKQMKEKM